MTQSLQWPSCGGGCVGTEMLLLGMLPYGHTHSTTWRVVTKYPGVPEVSGFVGGLHHCELS